MSLDSAVVDFIVVCFRNDAADLIRLRNVLLEGADQAGVDAQVSFVVNDQTDLDPGLHTRVIKGQGNIGFGAGVNLGVRTSNSQYVVFVNPDCEPNRKAVAELIGLLSPGCGLITPLIVDGNGAVDFHVYEHWTYTPTRRISAWVAARFLKNVDATTSSGLVDLPRFLKMPGTFVAAETGVARSLGSPFSESFFLYGEDRDLTIRARRRGVSLKLAQSVRIHHIGGVSGGRSEAISRCKADSLLRIAYRRYGRIGAGLAMIDMWFIAKTGRGQISSSSASWAIRRWGLCQGGEPAPLNARIVGGLSEAVAS